MKKNQNIPKSDSIVRYIPYSKLRKDGDDNILGVLGAAFQLRDGEPSLSATWLEYFAGERSEQIAASANAFRASISVGAKSGFAIGQVDAIKQECADRNHKIRIVYEPEDINKAHCAVRRFPREDFQLQELLATGVWSELHLNKSIPAGNTPAPDQPAARRAD